MVAREQEALKPGAIIPTYSMKSSFEEVVAIMGA